MSTPTAASSERVEGPPPTTAKAAGVLDVRRLRHSLTVLGRDDLANSTTLRKLLRIVALAAETFPGCYAAATVDAHEGEVCTNSAAYHLDRAQVRAGAGPAYEAAKAGRAVRVDVIGECPWLEFRRAALENSIASCLSVPFVCGPDAIGVLNVYSRQPSAFVGCEAGAAAFAAAAAALLGAGGPSTSPRPRT